MFNLRVVLRGCFVLLAAASTLGQAADLPPTEDDFYPITTFEIPEGVVLEAGGFQTMPSGELMISSRRGEIWSVASPLEASVPASRFRRFAHGLHEVLGLAERDGWLYVTQRCDISRLRDADADGQADIFEVVNDDWGISGDYHEYAFSSKFDREGSQWVVLCLTGSYTSDAPYRGWCVRITKDGMLIPTSSGIRSPGGIGFDAAGEVYYTDNQGPWNGTCSLKHLSPGKFVGHPDGFRWYDDPSTLASAVMGPRPAIPASGSRVVTEAARIPELEPPVILFPYVKMGQSAAGVACDVTGGKFGPFAGQMFVTDQSASTVMRCFLEEVNGVRQGACFPFRKGFGSGSLALEFHPEGPLFVGGTNRGWGSRGTKPFAVERVDWSGRTPFEIQEMRAHPEGFELKFTRRVDAETALNPASYALTTYTYIYQSSYGSPEVDHTTPTIRTVRPGADGQSLLLQVDGLQPGHIHELHAEGVRSQDGEPLLHPEAYYTLNVRK